MGQTLTTFYKDYRYGTKKSNFKPIFAILSVVVAIILLIISICAVKNPAKNYTAKDFYFVYAQKCTSVAQASEVSAQVSSLGGAGTIYAVGKTQFVVAAAFGSETYANNVLVQVAGQFETAGVLKVSTQSFSKSLSRQIESESACHDYYAKLLEFCYNLETWASSYQVGEMDASKVYRAVMQVKQSISSLSAGLEESDTDIAKVMYSSTLVVLEEIGNFFSSAFVSNSLGKYLYRLHVGAIVELIDMCELLKNI